MMFNIDLLPRQTQNLNNVRRFSAIMRQKR